jgi:hypothetical protein
VIDSIELERRLLGWAQEYGGGKYANVGWQGINLLQTLIDHQGFVPNSRGYIPVPIRSAADEVETIVCSMEAGDMVRYAKVLRCDYFLPNLSVDERLKRMRRVGFGMSRASYYAVLDGAKMYLRGELSAKSRAVA